MENKDQVIQEEIIETKVEEQVIEEVKPEIKQPSRNELLRELSQEYNVNLFDAEGIKQFKEYQDSKKNELEKYREEVERLKQREMDIQEELNKSRLNTLRIQHNIDEDKYEDFLTLASAYKNDETTYEQAFQKTLERYGDTFISKKSGVKLGIQVEADDKIQNGPKSFDEQVLESYLRRRK